jgi:hypothetical protein
MTLTAAERERRIKQYADGPARLRAAVEAVPPDAMKWRPAPNEFSVHEIVVHCADSETNAAARIRYIMAERNNDCWMIDTWASPSITQPPSMWRSLVEAVRANTVPVIERLNAGAWRKAGTHSESGRYTGNDWLSTYSEHLEEHIAQIKRAVSAWRAAGSPRAA